MMQQPTRPARTRAARSVVLTSGRSCSGRLRLWGSWQLALRRIRQPVLLMPLGNKTLEFFGFGPAFGFLFRSWELERRRGQRSHDHAVLNDHHLFALRHQVNEFG